MKRNKQFAGIAAAAFLAATSSMGAVFFETFSFSPSAPTVGTDAANLNGSTGQRGTWSGALPASTPTAHPNTPLAGSGELINPQDGAVHIDRPTADAFIRGNFTRPLVQDGTQINYNFALSRTTGSSHDKDVELVGLDAGGNEAFRIVHSARSGTAGGDRMRLGYYSGAGATLSWDFPDAGDANGNIAGGTGGQFNPNFSAITVNLTPAGYTVGFARAANWTSSLLPYNEAAGDLVAIEFRPQGSNNDGVNSGFFLDNLYAGAKQVPEPSTATLLLLGIVGIRYGRRFMKQSAV